MWHRMPSLATNTVAPRPAPWKVNGRLRCTSRSYRRWLRCLVVGFSDESEPVGDGLISAGPLAPGRGLFALQVADRRADNWHNQLGPMRARERQAMRLPRLSSWLKAAVIWALLSGGVASAAPPETTVGHVLSISGVWSATGVVKKSVNDPSEPTGMTFKRSWLVLSDPLCQDCLVWVRQIGGGTAESVLHESGPKSWSTQQEVNTECTSGPGAVQVSRWSL